MFPVYGLAEASLAVTFPRPGAPYHTLTVKRGSTSIGRKVEVVTPDHAAAVTLACVGYPIERCEVRIAADNGAPLPDMTVGRILIRGDNVARGYYRNPEATRIAVSDDGWLDTGDLGFRYEDGLIITGRRKEIIFVNGQNYYPQDIEVLLDKYGGIDLGKAAVSGARPPQGETDEVLVFVLYRGKLDAFVPLAKRVRKCVNEQIGIVVDHVIPVSKIPKTTSGKIQRYLLAQDYQADAYAAALAELRTLAADTSESAVGARSQIETALKEICDIYIKDKPLGIHDNIFELGTSSLTLAQIYQRIEGIYPGRIDVSDFFDYPTIAELAKYLEKRLAAA